MHRISHRAKEIFPLFCHAEISMHIRVTGVRIWEQNPRLIQPSPVTDLVTQPSTALYLFSFFFLKCPSNSQALVPFLRIQIRPNVSSILVWQHKCLHSRPRFNSLISRYRNLLSVSMRRHEESNTVAASRDLWMFASPQLLPECLHCTRVLMSNSTTFYYSMLRTRLSYRSPDHAPGFNRMTGIHSLSSMD